MQVKTVIWRKMIMINNKKLLILNTGGTFNKHYNSLTGELDIDNQSMALDNLFKAWLIEFTIKNIIGKDSLEMDNNDRKLITKEVKKTDASHIIIIHGTDTIDKTAEVLNEIKNKKIILTGAMVPFSIDPIEATANFASAYGYLNAVNENGVYIAINGAIGHFENIKKNRDKGLFEDIKKIIKE